jgi:hypothetical protein
MNKINNIVDKNEHGVVEQGVYIGGPGAITVDYELEKIH